MEITPATTASPSTRTEVEARRLVTVTLGDGTVILCRRAPLLDLMARGVLPFEFLTAARGITRDMDAAALTATRTGLESLAIWAALEPRISLTREPAPSAAVWVELLTLEELGDIYAAITTHAPVGAAAATTFRGGGDAAPGTAALHGEGVRAETQLVAVGGSADVEHR